MAERVHGTVAPEIVKQVNESTLLILDEGSFYIYKAMALADMELYKTLVSLKSPFLAKVYGTTLFEDAFFAVLEYVPGRTLEDYLQKHGTMTEREASAFGCDICSGLSVLHGKGVIHRDLTPNNIMVTPSGSIKIIDFGISRLERAGAAKDTEFLGTAGFAAPEQFGFRQTSARTDIYTVGVLINYMCTLQLPNEQLASGRLGYVVSRCVKMDEEDRYSSAEVLRKVLLGELPVDVNEQNPERVSPPVDEKHPVLYPKAIPGFRRGVLWHKVLAVWYYMGAVLLFFSSFFLTEYGVAGRIMLPIAFFFLLLAPVFVFFDMGDWTERFALTRGHSKEWKSLWKCLFCTICYAVSIMIIRFFT